MPGMSIFLKAGDENSGPYRGLAGERVFYYSWARLAGVRVIVIFWSLEFTQT
jgi:hypothetical protein